MSEPVPVPPTRGQHLVADLAATRGLDDPALIEAVLREAAAAAGAHVLDVRLHRFPENGMGVTGVALLAESHISIHTWPEHGLAAIDVFVCGANARPRAALAVMVERFAARVLSECLIERLTQPPPAPARPEA